MTDYSKKNNSNKRTLRPVVSYFEYVFPLDNHLKDTQYL